MSLPDCKSPLWVTDINVFLSNMALKNCVILNHFLSIMYNAADLVYEQIVKGQRHKYNYINILAA